MSKTITGTSFGLFCFAATSALYFLTAAAQEPKGNEKKQDDKPASIAGAWDVEDRFLSMGTLYQPEHAVRTKAAKISAATAPISKIR